jgi:aminoglycoside-2''-adenylyltransferase
MRAGRGREPQRDMSAEDVVAIVRRLQRAGLAVWLDGGWGVDALVRRQTRPHDDLDVVVRLEDVPAVERELAALGYERAGARPDDGAPAARRGSFESVDAEGRQVDVHPIARDGAYVNRDGTIWHYPRRGLRGKGAVAGHGVDCLTAEVQVICHAGYELDEDDLHDLRLLCPARDVLDAFDACGEPEPLAGGTGRAWRVGDLVLKPLDADVAWQHEVLANVEENGFRVERPRAEVVDGWTAWTYVEGRHEPRRWREIIAAGERFHAALPAARPPARSDNAWDVGDRVAWGELPYPAVDELLAALEPVDDPPRLMHGDLTGNVLFHESLPPAIIDFAPYYRPPQYASAIVVADALCWEGGPAELADAVDRPYLLRALIYRAVTSFEFGGDAARELEVASSFAA